MGRWRLNVLQMLDFKIFKFEKHLSSFTHLETRTLVILASLKYLNNLWHNTLKNKMICHNQVTRLKSKGIFIAFNVWFFIGILKRLFCKSSVKLEIISNTKIGTTFSSLGKARGHLQIGASKQHNVLGRILWHLLEANIVSIWCQMHQVCHAKGICCLIFPRRI